MSTEQFYRDLATRHRLFYADWHGFLRLESVWLHTLFRPLGVQNVLDCTCGIGTQAIALAQQAYHVTACDLSEANLAEAQSNADELDLTVLWQQADVRHLDEASLDGPFDAVISLGNSLSHLLTEDDMIAALRHMVDHAKPGGLVLVGQRDWDAIAVERPHFHFRHEHPDTPAPGRRTVLFDLWHYDDPLVTFEVFFLTGPSASSSSHSFSSPSEGEAGRGSEEAGRGWATEVFPLRYRMWQRKELVELMEQAGLADVHKVECDWELRLAAARPKH